MDKILEVYAVRNSDGQWLRSKGYGGSGEIWVDDLRQARLYPKIGPARGRVTWFTKNYPEYPMPDLVKLTVTQMEVVTSEKERVEDKIRKAEAAKFQAEIRQRNKKVAQMKEEIATLQTQLEQIQKDKD